MFQNDETSRHPVRKLFALENRRCRRCPLLLSPSPPSNSLPLKSLFCIPTFFTFSIFHISSFSPPMLYPCPSICVHILLLILSFLMLSQVFSTNIFLILLCLSSIILYLSSMFLLSNQPIVVSAAFDAPHTAVRRRMQFGHIGEERRRSDKIKMIWECH